ncbi:MAG TPA: hypothetical protein VNQ74_09790, partial [Burkholderiaceae bacterium]|nr:hypothetical protein [Burkholderiaceae bacterium]
FPEMIKTLRSPACSSWVAEPRLCEAFSCNYYGSRGGGHLADAALADTDSRKGPGIINIADESVRAGHDPASALKHRTEAASA